MSNQPTYTHLSDKELLAAAEASRNRAEAQGWPLDNLWAELLARFERRVYPIVNQTPKSTQRKF